MKCAIYILSLGWLFWSNWAFAELPPAPAGAPAPAPNLAISNEFEDLLSDNPTPRKEAAAKPAAGNPFEEKEPEKIKTWSFDEQKQRTLSSEPGPVPPAPGVVKQKTSGLLGEKLPEEVDKTPLDLGPVEWDLDTKSEGQAANEAPPASEVSIILSQQNFFPATIRLAPDKQAKLYFTTTNKKPAALIIERLNIQRWIAKDGAPVPQNDVERAPWEITREVGFDRVTEVTIVPKKGSYSFYDALSGARGEIVVE
ncbi:MAG: hypothetical protein H6617_00470 [Bdellovibrionaceae bacterium]|nr:hypothetical protein [Bdellovibrionales bacterium]MCB9253141.1 hypothetical protein [Pseudobdellovibrionaceae bacterium]